jgi:hypothetical protein
LVCVLREPWDAGSRSLFTETFAFAGIFPRLLMQIRRTFVNVESPVKTEAPVDNRASYECGGSIALRF